MIADSIDPANLRIFGFVAETRSFRKAAEHLRMGPSTVSRRVAEFEHELGVALLNRSTRRLSLTEAGERLNRRWQRIAGYIDDAFDEIRGVDERPTGVLKVSLPSSLGAALLPSLIADFKQEFRDLRFNLDLREQGVDIIGQGFDVVICVTPTLTDSRLVGRRLTTTRYVLAASPSYIDAHGSPDRLQALQSENFALLDGCAKRQISWNFASRDCRVQARVRPSWAVNNDLVLILAACLGAGIVYMPQILITNELRIGQLREIQLDDAQGVEVGVYALYPKPNPPSKVRLFVDFASTRLKTLADFNRWSPLQGIEKHH